MKHCMISLLLAAILMSLCSCTSLSSSINEEQTSESIASTAETENTQTEASIDPALFADLKTVTEKYVSPVLSYGKMTTYNWDSPSQILADDLVNICMSNNYLQLPTSPDNKPISEYGEYLTDHVAADEVEAVYPLPAL